MTIFRTLRDSITFLVSYVRGLSETIILLGLVDYFMLINMEDLLGVMERVQDLPHSPPSHYFISRIVISLSPSVSYRYRSNGVIVAGLKTATNHSESVNRSLRYLKGEEGKWKRDEGTHYG